MWFVLTVRHGLPKRKAGPDVSIEKVAQETATATAVPPTAVFAPAVAAAVLRGAASIPRSAVAWRRCGGLGSRLGQG